MNLPKSDQQFLLKLAREALEYIFETGKELKISEEKVPQSLRKKGATFVTLTQDGKLRGCIGKLVAVKELYHDVIENIYSAAFNDPRFAQLERHELETVRIEISILTKPQELQYKDCHELEKMLQKDKPGVILEQGLYSATFLPQVWEELPSSSEFLFHLCRKAGLDGDMYKTAHPKIYTYTVTKCYEKEIR